MKNEALLKVILRDVKELELLVTTFISEDHILDGYIQLAKIKAQAILEELNSLSQSEKSLINSEVKQPTVEEIKSNLVSDSIEPEIKKTQRAEIIDEALPKKLKNPVKLKEDVDQVKAVEVEQNEPKVGDKMKEMAGVEKQSKLEEKTELPTSTRPPSEVVNISIASQDKKSVSQTVLGEVLGKDTKSLNEQLFHNSTASEATFQSPISDLKSAIGINDRFLYQRELFDNKAEVFDQVVAQINIMPDYDSSIAFLKSNFSWNFEKEAVVSFLDLVKRRFKTK